MKNACVAQAPVSARRSGADRGFSLIEILVAMAIFLIVTGVAFSLFSQHTRIATRQENLSGVNISLRNAVSQLQMDLAGAGQNLLTGVPGAPSFSVGILVQNNVPGKAAPCAPNPDWSYPTPSACYDSLTIFNLGVKAPILVIADPGNREGLDSSSIIFAADPADPTGANRAADAAAFKSGDEVLVFQPNNTNVVPPAPPPTCGSAAGSFYCITVVTLTKNGNVAGNKIQLQHNPTGAAGQPVNCPGIGCTDPAAIIFNPLNSTGTNFTNALGPGFSNGAYLIDIGNAGGNITYTVLPNPANPADPQLVRCVGACVVGNTQTLADQVIGFKVGAALSNNEQNGTEIASFFYDASKYCNGALTGDGCAVTPFPAADLDPYDFTLVRSLRVSLIARTAPGADISLADFQNGFDRGPYLVQQASTVVDLRNISMNDFGN